MKTKLIRLSEEHYEKLKQLGRMTDSFNQVVGRLLEKDKNGGQNPSRQHLNQTALHRSTGHSTFIPDTEDQSDAKKK